MGAGRMIQLENVSFQYDQSSKTKVIDQLHLTIEQGEYITIVGPNGSGKSTLARLINGLLLPHEGHVYVNEWCTQDEQERWNIHQHIGMIFQNPENQMVATTVLDDVAFGLENLGVPSQQMMIRIESALKAVNMWEHRDREPHHLSGGQKQRIAVAGILAMKPKVMVFDEATAMLDPEGRKQLVAMMTDLHREGFTIIHITHSMEEAWESKRLVVMGQGKIIRDGKPEIILEEKELLHHLHLQSPFVLETRNYLTSCGLPLPHHIQTEGDLLTALWTLELKT